MKTILLFLIGFFVMVTGLIEWLFLGFLVWLGLCLVAEVINNIRKQQVVKNQADFWDKT
ncbi:hypothetical protein N7621_000133 [Salmonella enterica]|uniref:Uncharacterized protein n=2 Tax=Salmonella enterica TaxID=28901 RepID=A0A7G6AQL4_SALET|nr:MULTISPECIES: hypothetical protein [Enterobacteriaceae]EDR7495884.1 hypothetical protein [Salmonella enterica subsp. enterica serovar Kiambu]EDU3946554.1 hypothetical protein [Salmonella enterica subsp. enterica serovar 4,[5],12:b:-]EDX2778730.1 hypothetical protein [Salmonella enterica subsp. enterica serovar 4,12:nonmotile]EEV4957343.1 hypothetical protein [Salmonella enterica subsp. enterica serovar Muenchen]EIP6624473.1 hypothetical protein [Salmonella enterica subsp. enterica serovar S